MTTQGIYNFFHHSVALLVGWQNFESGLAGHQWINWKIECMNSNYSSRWSLATMGGSLHWKLMLLHAWELQLRTSVLVQCFTPHWRHMPWGYNLRWICESPLQFYPFVLFHVIAISSPLCFSLFHHLTVSTVHSLPSLYLFIDELWGFHVCLWVSIYGIIPFPSNR